MSLSINEDIVLEFLKRLSNLKKVNEVELGDQFVKSCSLELKGTASDDNNFLFKKFEIGQKQTHSSSYYIRFGEEKI